MKKLITTIILMIAFVAGLATVRAQGRDYRQSGPSLEGGENGQQGPRQGPRHRGPPEEAIEACANLGEGDACAFVVPERNLEGTCRNIPRSEEIACVPADHHPPGGMEEPQ